MSNEIISVIIPAGRPDRVAITVRSLLSQNFPRDLYEIIVVTPDFRTLPSDCPDGIRVISTGALFPPGRMRNIGAQEAQAGLLCFLDDDCLAPEDFLNHMVHILQTSDQVGAVGCRVVALDATFWNRCADQALFTAYQARRAGITTGLGSAALAVRRDAFMDAGRFDEELMASEDWDFSLKLRQGGWQCWFAPEIEVRHDHGRGSFQAILRAAWQYGRASGLTVQRRHVNAVSWVARLMATAADKRIYWLLILPYSCFLTLVWLIEARPVKLIPCLPVLFLARLAYQGGVLKALKEEYNGLIL